MSDLTKETVVVQRLVPSVPELFSGLREAHENAKRHYAIALDRIAALERENAVLEENAIRFREERDRLRQSQSHEPEGYYVEELCEGRWSRCALGFMWAKEDDARTQLEELRRRYGGRCFRLHGDYSSETSGICPHGMPLAENICGICSEGKPNRPAQNTKGGQS